MDVLILSISKMNILAWFLILQICLVSENKALVKVSGFTVLASVIGSGVYTKLSRARNNGSITLYQRSVILDIQRLLGSALTVTLANSISVRPRAGDCWPQGIILLELLAKNIDREIDAWDKVSCTSANCCR